MAQWDFQFKGHSIKIENSSSQQRLFVDGELQDELYGMGFRSRMYGVIRDGESAGEEVMVSLGGFWSVICRVFVDRRLVYHSKPDSIAARFVEENNAS